MTNEEILAEVATLPQALYRDNARQSIAFLMKSRGLSLDDAVLAFSALVQDNPAYDTAARRQNSTGVR
jgi:hypothetical protein